MKYQCYVPKEIAITYRAKDIKPGNIFRTYCKIISYHLKYKNKLIINFPIQSFFYIPLFALSSYYYYLEKTYCAKKSKILVFSTKNKKLNKIFDKLKHSGTDYYISTFVESISFSNKLKEIKGDYKVIIIDVANLSFSQLKKVLSVVKSVNKPVIFVSSFFNQESYKFIDDSIDVSFFGINPEIIKRFSPKNGEEIMIFQDKVVKISNEHLYKNFCNKTKIQFVNNKEINKLLSKCWKHYYYLRKKDEVDHGFLYLYRHALRYLSWLYFPLDSTSKYTSPYSNIEPINRILNKLDEYSSLSKDKILKTAVLDFKILNDIINENGKSKYFIKIVNSLIKSNDKILILVQSPQEKYILEDFLSENLKCSREELYNQVGVHIFTSRSIFKINENYNWGIFPTFLNHTSKAFSLISSPLINNAVLLAYQPEYKYYQKVIRSLNKEWNEYTINKSLIPFIDEKYLKQYKKRPKIKDFNKDKDVKKLYETWDDVIKETLEIEDEITDEDIDTGFEATITKLPEGIKKYRIKFDNGNEIDILENENLDILTSEYNVKTKKAAEVKTGDHAIIYDYDFHKTKLELLLEELSKIPEYKKYYKYIVLWRKRANINLTNIDYNYVLYKIREKGSKINSPVTIYGWKRGYVLGPRDPRDIKRLSEIFHDSILKSLWREIAKSMKRIRGLDIKAGKVLSKTIREMSEGLLRDFSEKKIDKKTGITLTDIADNLDVIRIVDKKVISD